MISLLQWTHIMALLKKYYIKRSKEIELKEYYQNILMLVYKDNNL